MRPGQSGSLYDAIRHTGEKPMPEAVEVVRVEPPAVVKAHFPRKTPHRPRTQR